jgi:homoserine kinase
MRIRTRSSRLRDDRRSAAAQFRHNASVSLPFRFRAPATTANLGPGFDSAGAALDLWNELEVSLDDDATVVVEGEGAGEVPTDSTHLGLRAFSLLAPLHDTRFRFTNRIPLSSGLGSSAATIALGLVAGASISGRDPDAEALLEAALELEQHPDNLAPALAGGVCLTWRSNGRQRIAQVAVELPLVPLIVVPVARVETVAARAALPSEVPHDDAAFTAGRAALLGAALASGSAELLGEAFADRLHEPYRGPLSPVYEPLREHLPAGAAGLTISGSGPTVIVWARPGEERVCGAELRERFPAAQVMQSAISAAGAGPVPA